MINPGEPSERQVGGKASLDLEYGDVVSFRLSGGGGYGDPRERDPRAVSRDVRLGLVSPKAAREQYGVVVTPDGAVDEDATQSLRNESAPDVG